MFLDNSIVLTNSDKIRILSEIKTLVKENKFEINLNTSSREKTTILYFNMIWKTKRFRKTSY